MIDSNNIDVIRTNIRTLNEKVLESNGDIATIIEDVSDLEDDIESIENTIGTTPLPTGQTITSALSFVNFGNLYGVDLRETDSGILSVKLYITIDKVDNDRLEIQFNTNTSKVRYLKYVSGEKTFDKSVTLA